MSFSYQAPRRPSATDLVVRAREYQEYRQAAMDGLLDDWPEDVPRLTEEYDRVFRQISRQSTKQTCGVLLKAAGWVSFGAVELWSLASLPDGASVAERVLMGAGAGVLAVYTALPPLKLGRRMVDESKRDGKLLEYEHTEACLRLACAKLTKIRPDPTPARLREATVQREVAKRETRAFGGLALASAAYLGRRLLAREGGARTYAGVGFAAVTSAAALIAAHARNQCEARVAEHESTLKRTLGMPLLFPPDTPPELRHEIPADYALPADS